MSKFNKNFKMNELDAIEYAKEKIDFLKESDELKCKEIGDGNINYVFKVWDEKTKKSVIIKHADNKIRSSGSEITTDRNRIEAEILQLEDKFAPGMVPKVYFYDSIMCCLVMEDLSDHEIMRYSLMDFNTYDMFADYITDFLVNTLLLTTDLVMEPKEKKELVKKYINPDMCNISEKLVFTDPYYSSSEKNKVSDENVEFVKKEVYDDEKLHLEVAKVKNGFKNNAQALIHGDLHTGSIFIKPYSVKVIDPEFAYYGPIGYDVGNVIGNLFFSWAYSFVTLEESNKKNEFIEWLNKTISNIIDLFKEKFIVSFNNNVKDKTAKTKGFCEWYLNNILEDTAAVTGLEMMRRTVGSAKVKEITSIDNNEKRVLIERILILTAKEFIVNRAKYKNGEDYIKNINNVIKGIENI